MIRPIGKALLYALAFGLAASLRPPGAQAAAPRKIRLLIVSSYHAKYLWEQDVQDGVCAALRDFKFLSHDNEIADYRKNDYAEGADAVVRHLWMDTKRKNKKSEILNVTAQIMPQIAAFKPDLVILGDDNAANFIGTQLLDGPIPAVFYGMDVHPLKYGLIDSVGHPGHNVTGIYQSFYFKEVLETLQKLVPSVKTFGILSDDSETGRAKTKVVKGLAEQGQLPLKLVRAVVTNSYAKWQSEARKLAQEADALLVVNHNTLKDDHGNPVDQMTAGAWYLRHIKKPDCAGEKQFAEEGILLVVDDSGFKQGYEALRTASQILKEGRNPADMPPRSPGRGKIIVNKQRADALGIGLKDKPFIEETIERSKALE